MAGKLERQLGYGDCDTIGPVTAAAMAEGKVKRWLVDTGAGAHFVGRKYLTQQQIDAVVSLDPIRLAIANGVISADKGAWLYVDELELWIMAYILEDSPPALSAGRLCRESGCNLNHIALPVSAATNWYSGVVHCEVDRPTL